MQKYTVEVIEDSAVLEILEPAWRELATAIGAPAFSFASWALACWDQTSPSDRLQVVTVHESGDLVALGPFYETGRRGLRVVRFLGTRYGQTARVLVLPEHAEAVGALFEPFRARGAVLQLFDFDESGGLEALRRHPGWVVQTRLANTCLRVDTKFSLDEHIQTRPRKHRKTLRVAHDLLVAEGLALQVNHARTQSEMDVVLPEIFALERAARHDRPYGGMHDDLASGRLPSLLQAMQRAGQLHLLSIRIGGRVAGYTISLLGGGVLTGKVIGHDTTMRRFSPGHLCIAELIRWSHEEGLREVDLSVGDYFYKNRWSDDAYCTFDVLAAPSQARLSATTLALDAIGRSSALVGKLKGYVTRAVRPM